MRGARRAGAAGGHAEPGVPAGLARARRQRHGQRVAACRAAGVRAARRRGHARPRAAVAAGAGARAPRAHAGAPPCNGGAPPRWLTRGALPRVPRPRRSLLLVACTQRLGCSTAASRGPCEAADANGAARDPAFRLELRVCRARARSRAPSLRCGPGQGAPTLGAPAVLPHAAVSSAGLKRSIQHAEGYAYGRTAGSPRTRRARRPRPRAPRRCTATSPRARAARPRTRPTSTSCTATTATRALRR